MKNYTVRPMGINPAASVTITDSQIIYNTGIVGSEVKQASIDNASISFSTLVKGGELVVKEYGQEAFRVSGILNPKGFNEAFNIRKAVLAEKQRAPSPAATPEPQRTPIPTPQPHAQRDPSQVAHQRNLGPKFVTPTFGPLVIDVTHGINEYFFEGKKYHPAHRQVIIDRATDKISREIKSLASQAKHSFARTIARKKPTKGVSENTTSVAISSRLLNGITTPSDNKDIVHNAINRAYEDGIITNDFFDFPTKVVKFSAGFEIDFGHVSEMNYGAAYIPECELYVFLNGGHVTMATSDFDELVKHAKQEFEYGETVAKNIIKGQVFGTLTAAGILAIFGAVAAAFAEEQPVDIQNLPDADSEQVLYLDSLEY